MGLHPHPDRFHPPISWCIAVRRGDYFCRILLCQCTRLHILCSVLFSFLDNIPFPFLLPTSSESGPQPLLPLYLFSTSPCQKPPPLLAPPPPPPPQNPNPKPILLMHHPRPVCSVFGGGGPLSFGRLAAASATEECVYIHTELLRRRRHPVTHLWRYGAGMGERGRMEEGGGEYIGYIQERKRIAVYFCYSSYIDIVVR